MATIRSLPPELLCRIIRLVSQVDTSARAPLTFLAAAARVCRAWAPAAQELLWREVLLDGGGRIFPSPERFIASPAAGRYMTSSLHYAANFSDYSARETAATAGVIQACRGLEKVSLMWLRKVDLSVFCAPSMKGALILVSQSFTH